MRIGDAFVFYGLLIICLIFSTGVYSQSSDSFNYQAVIRNTDGTLIQNQKVSVVFTIENSFGTAYYSERQDTVSDAYGVINLLIGKGDVISGNWGSINWKESLQLIVSIDYDDDGMEDLNGRNTIQSVPKANFSERAVVADGLSYELAKVATSGDYNDLSNKPNLVLKGDTLSIEGGNSVKISSGTSGGNMIKEVYDTNNNGVVDVTENANLVNSLTVRTAVPTGAVFTDNQSASEVAVTPNPSVGLTSGNVQAALEELQGEIENGGVNDATSSSKGVVQLAGDLTGTADAPRIANNAVTNAKLSTGIDVTKLADGSVSNTELQRLGNVTGDVQAQLDSKASTSSLADVATSGDYADLVNKPVNIDEDKTDDLLKTDLVNDLITGGVTLVLTAEQGKVLKNALDQKAAATNVYTKTETDNLLTGKVNTEVGKGLSENDYTNTEKTLLAGAEQAANKNTANGYAGLDANSKIDVSQLPAITINNVYTVGSEGAMLGLSVVQGDMAIRTDVSQNYIHNGGTTGGITDWTELAFPNIEVTSVNGKTGDVVVGIADISTLQTELNSKANSSDLATVATSGSFNDLTNVPANIDTDATNDLLQSDIINDLTTGGTTKVLSAEQGKVLKTVVGANATGIANNTTSITTNATNISQNAADIALKENTANKSADATFTDNSDVLFPTQKAVKTYVDATVASGAPDATTTAKGKIQLAGDFTGTADAPTIANNAVTNAKVATGIDAMKLADGSVSNTEFQYLNGTTNNIQSQITNNAINITTNATNIALNASKVALADTAGVLRSKINAVNTIGTTLQGELDATQTGSGLTVDGDYLQNSSANYIGSATSLADADNALDAQLKTNADSIDVNATDISTNTAAISANTTNIALNATKVALADTAGVLRSEIAAANTIGTTLQSELDATQTGSGLTVDGDYLQNNTANYISTATSLADADNALDAQLKTNADGISTNATNISQNTSDISDNATDITTNTTNIALNATKVALADTAGVLRSEIEAANTIGTTLQSELDATQTGSGLTVDGDYLQNNTANYISTATSLAGADDILDTQLKVNADSIDSNATDISTNTAAISANTTNIALNASKVALADTAGVLRSEINAVNTIGTTLQGELDATQTGSGLGADGTYTENNTANYISTATSLAGADDILDAQIKTNADAITTNATNITTNTTNIALNTTKVALADTAGVLRGEINTANTIGTALQNELDATQSGSGLGANGTYSANGSANYIGSATSLAGADDILDVQLKTNADAISTNTTNISQNTSNIALKENAANKSTDGTLVSESDVKFPTEKAVKTYVDNTVASGAPDATPTTKGKIQLAGDLTGTAVAPLIADDAVTAAKIGTDVAGNGLVQNATTGALDVVVAELTGDGSISSTDLTVTGGTNAVLNDVTLDINAGAVTDAKVATGINAAKLADGSVSNDELQHLDGVTGDIQAQLDAKVNTSSLADIATSGDYADLLNKPTNIDEDKTDDLLKADLVNDLTTGGTTKALTAEQGKILKDALDQKAAATNVYTKNEADNLLANKVEVEAGKGLSANDYTNADKTLVTGAEQTSNKNVANGYAGLDANSKIDVSQLPAITINNVFTVTDESELPGLSAVQGDMAIVTGSSTNYIRNAGTSGTISDWTELASPNVEVTSVNGKTGAVTIGITDIATLQTTLDEKANSADLATVATSGSFADLSNVPANIDTDGTNDVLKSDIINDLTTGGTDKVLSAEQGKILKTSVDANATAIADNTSDITTNASNIASNTTNIALKENSANKSADGTFTDNSDVLFPTQKAVKTYVDATVASGAPDATTTSKGKVQLAGDLTGTADAPTIANSAVTNAKVASGIDAAKLADGSISNTELQYVDGATSNIQTQINTLSTAATTVQNELDATQTGAGLGSGGNYTANTSTNYMKTATSLKDATEALDTQIKVNADAINNGNTTIQGELDATQTGAGLETDGTYSANTSANYIGSASSLADADDALDAQLKVNADAIALRATQAALTDTATAIRGALVDSMAAVRADAFNVNNLTDTYVPYLNGTGLDDSPMKVANGKVGIATSGAPTQALDVNGNINIAENSAYMYGGYKLLKFEPGGTSAGYTNILLGQDAARNNVDRSYQTVIGFRSGYSSDGLHQTLVGSNAGMESTNADRQTAFGIGAGQRSSGVSQTAIGAFAGQDNTGDYQTSLGYFSGNGNTGNDNTLLGAYAGRDNNADNVIAIGYYAGQNNTTPNQFIVQQNNVNTTPLIQGDFATGNINTAGKITVDSVASADMDLVPFKQMNDSLAAVRGGTLNADNLTDTYVPYLNGTGLDDSPIKIATGKVGIGTTDAPKQALDVAGNININAGSAYMYNGVKMIQFNSPQSVMIGDSAIAAGSDSHTLVGYRAGKGTTGRFTTAIGREALIGNTGASPSAVGYTAGKDNIGSVVSLFGREAGRGNQGDYLTAIGYQAGQNNAGEASVAIGREAGKDNTGDNSIAIGPGAGTSNSGAGLVGLGIDAGKDNEAVALLAIGLNSGLRNKGLNLTAIGGRTGIDNTGEHVIGMGNGAIMGNQGDYVIALGYEAGRNNTLDNQFIVKQTPVNTTPLIQGDFATGNLNIAGKVTAGANATANMDLVPLAQMNDSLAAVRADAFSVDNLTSAYVPYYDGTGLDDSPVTVRGTNVGIGINSPDANLHVYDGSSGYSFSSSTSGLIIEDSGDAYLYISGGSGNTGHIQFGDDNSPYAGKLEYDHSVNAMTFSTNGANERMRINSSGNVGIGTTSPTEKLDVVGDIKASVDVIAGNDVIASGKITTGEVATSNMDLVPLGQMNDSLAAARAGTLNADNLTSSYMPYYDGTGLANSPATITGSRFGFNVANPTTSFHIKFGDSGQAWNITDHNLLVEDSNYARLTLSGANGSYISLTDGDEPSWSRIIYTSSDKSLAFFNDKTEKMRINSSGNVGIGTTAPAEKLDVAGNIKASGKVTAGANATANMDLVPFKQMNDSLAAVRADAFSVDNLTSAYVPYYNGTGLDDSPVTVSAGNVGIGTTTPENVLAIERRLDNRISDVGDFSSYLLTLQNTRGVNGNTAGLAFKNTTDSYDVVGAAIVHRRTGGYSQGTLDFYTKRSTADGVAPELAMSLTEGGNMEASGKVTAGANATANMDLVPLAQMNDSLAAVRADANNSTLQTELNNTQAGAGLGNNGSYSANTSTNYMKTSSSLVDATEDLDGQVKSNADAIALRATQTALVDSIAAVRAEAFSVDNLTSSYVPYYNGSILNNSPVTVSGTNVGIGTPTPGSELHVKSGTSGYNFGTGNDGIIIEDSADPQLTISGSSGNTGHIYFGDNSSNASGQLEYNHSVDAMTFSTSAGNERMRINSSGNVGIGTASPSSRLHIWDGSSGFSFGTNTDGLIIEDTGDPQLFISGSTGNIGHIYFGDNASSSSGQLEYLHSANAMTFSTNGANERMRINSSGDVGIGTTSPAEKLDVNGNTKSTGFIVESGTKKIMINVSGTGTNADDAAISMLNSNSNQYGMLFGRYASTKNSASVKFNYSTSGSNSNYLGIGMYGNDDLLKVFADGVTEISSDYGGTVRLGDSNRNGIRMLHSSSDFYGLLFGRNENRRNSGAIRFSYSANDSYANYVGIGFYAYDDVMKIHGNGDVYIPNGILYENSDYSDRRLKNSIKTLEPLSAIDSIRFVSFKFNKDSIENRQHYGVIAQEVQKYFPELVTPVSMDGENEYLTMNYVELLLLKVASLEQKLASQEERLRALEERMNNK